MRFKFNCSHLGKDIFTIQLHHVQTQSLQTSIVTTEPSASGSPNIAAYKAAIKSTFKSTSADSQSYAIVPTEQSASGPSNIAAYKAVMGDNLQINQC